ncbi:MAG: acetyl-CoA decarbonylase/synthase complex subunit gamma [Anaerolineales bacterium]|jgi:acetyl-CoA decarbonylase/synthase, CODH/ACS complex subunit gamma
MALSGIQIYKMLPQTNCKECGFPTCLAFAMKLAAKQVELASCPYVSEESKAKLAESATPPIRLVTLKSDGFEVKAGNEVVLFRHEKTFYNKPGIFIKVRADASPEEIKAQVTAAGAYTTNYVGLELFLDGFAVEASGDAQAFANAVQAVRGASHKPLILISRDPAVMAAGLGALDGEVPLVYAADPGNWEAMADLAKQHKAALAVSASTLEELADLTEKIKAKGVEDLVLDPDSQSLSSSVVQQTQIRRLALKKNFKALGYPSIAFPTDEASAAQAIAKYAGFIVLDHFAPELAYPLLVLRQNIYTDPQKPIQVQPGLYEINNPKAEDPLLVTTNFSITYFSVANEVEGSGLPAWLMVADAEGMSVLTAWAAGKFDAERIAKAVKTFNVADKVSRKRIVIPGHVAVLSGELEGELPGWEIRVGPREAVDLPSFMKQAL